VWWVAYVYVEPQDRVFLARPLESCDFGLEFVLWLPLLCRVRCGTVVSRSALWPAILGLAVPLSFYLVVLLLLLGRMRLVLWLPLLRVVLLPAAARPFSVVVF
jgi:hypothetical protein